MEAGPRDPKTTFGGRAKRMLPFVAVSWLTLPLALIGRGPEDSLALVAAAAAVLLVVTLLVLVVPWDRLPLGSRLVLVVGYCIVVALLRHSGGGGTAGYGGLLLLPIINQAVYARWRDVLAAVACTTLTLSLPILAFGAPHYPASEWRRVILSIMTFTLAGLVVNQLMERVTRQRRMLGRVIELTRELDGPHGPARVCDVVREATDADLVTFIELGTAGGFEVSIADRRADAVALAPYPLAELPPDVRAVIETREPCFIADLAAHPDVDQGARAGLDLASIHHQPVIQAGEVQAVISVGWRRTLRRLDDDVVEGIELLAAEASLAIERSRLIAQLDRLAHHDQLTGVLNRLAWDQAFERELARVGRSREPAALALLDLDHFKSYNDAHGHLRGDQLLKGATAAWSAELRAMDVLARWGGEEFVLLLPATTMAEAEAVLARLRAVTPSGQSFSAGLVTVDDRPGQDLLRAVDAALYRAKAAGRACTVIGSDPAGSVLPRG